MENRRNGFASYLEKLVPPTTFAFFRSPEAAPVIARIRGTANVVHH